MTDLDMLKLCAEALGLQHSMRVCGFAAWPVLCASRYDDPIVFQPYNPLRDDAQALALVKHFRMDIKNYFGESNTWVVVATIAGWDLSKNADLNRAIVECAAKCEDRFPQASLPTPKENQ
jgi:hypothetical protein